MNKLGNESGQTLVMVALSMAVLLGFTAFATDVGVMLHEKREIQTAADSAAIAAATAVTDRQDGVAAGKYDASLNGFTDQATDSSGNVITTVTINLTPKYGHFANVTPGYVEAIITQQTPTFFMHLFSRNAMTVSARAVATTLGQSTGCGWVPNLNNVPVAGNPWGNTTIQSPDCGWEINGNLNLGASDAMNAAYVGTTGTITGWNTKYDSGTTATGIPSFTDPLSWLQNALPTDNGNGTCTPPADPNNPTAALPNCFVNKPLSGTLQPGIYFYNSPAAATYTGNVVGNNVTIILTNGSLLSNSGGSGAGNATLTLSKSTSGFYSGVVLDAPTYTGELSLDFGATNATFTGAVYAPYADLSLQDQGAMSSTGFGVTVNGDLVIGTLDIYDKNKGNLELNHDLSGGPSVIPRITLVE